MITKSWGFFIISCDLPAQAGKTTDARLLRWVQMDFYCKNNFHVTLLAKLHLVVFYKFYGIQIVWRNLEVIQGKLPKARC